MKQESLEQLKKILKKEYDIDLTNQEALAYGNRLVNLARLIVAIKN